MAIYSYFYCCLKNMAGIYIHIPFCKKLCSYCDFYKIISSGDYSSYIEALLREAEMRKSYLSDEIVSTIYLGGGTPSVLSLKEIERILNGLAEHFIISNDCEITIELNPDDLDGAYLKGLKKLNINGLNS